MMDTEHKRLNRIPRILMRYDWFHSLVVMYSRPRTHRHVVGVDVVGTLLVVGRQQLDTRSVVRQDVGEAILVAVRRQLGRDGRLFPTDKLQVLQ